MNRHIKLKLFRPPLKHSISVVVQYFVRDSVVDFRNFLFEPLKAFLFKLHEFSFEVQFFVHLPYSFRMFDVFPIYFKVVLVFSLVYS